MGSGYNACRCVQTCRNHHDAARKTSRYAAAAIRCSDQRKAYSDYASRMIIELKLSKSFPLTAFVEKHLAKQFRLPKRPLSAYLPLEEVATYLDAPTRYLFNLAATSPVLHGFIMHNRLYLHPQAVVRYARQKFRRKIRKALYSLSSRNPPTLH